MKRKLKIYGNKWVKHVRRLDRDRQTAMLNCEISAVWETKLTTTMQKTSRLLMRPELVTRPKTLKAIWWCWWWWVRLIIPRIRNVWDESCRENQNTFYNKWFFFENHGVYEIMWIIKIQLDKPQMIKWFTRISYWIRKATNTHSECVTRIAFRCKNGCFNVPKCYVRHTYIAWLVIYFM